MPPVCVCCGTVALNYLSKSEALQVFRPLIYYTASRDSSHSPLFFPPLQLQMHMHSETKKDIILKSRKYEWNLIARRKTSFYAPTVLLPRLNSCIQTEKQSHKQFYKLRVQEQGRRVLLFSYCIYPLIPDYSAVSC